MPYLSPQHLETALAYLAENAHPQLITLLAMFRAGLQISDDDQDASAFGAREENLLLGDYFKPEGGSEESPFYVPFGSSPTSRWRDYRYAGRSLQRMRKDRQNAGLIFRQSSTDNKRWTLRTTFVGDLTNNAADSIGSVPFSLAMLATWLYRLDDVGSVAEATTRAADEFNLAAYGVVGQLFSTQVPAELSALQMQNQPMGPDEILSLLEAQPTGGGTAEAEETQTGGLLAEEPPGRWDIDASEIGDLCGLAGLEDAALQALAALRSGMHVILTGPPGSGKTSLAVCLCARAGFPSWTVSATDQWTTFDTIGGYFPSLSGDAQGEQLDFLPGHVVDSIERQKCLIIDEINRADIDKAFGEMFTLLSGQSVTLPFRRKGTDGVYRRVRLTHGSSLGEDDLETIELPGWWRILGAMNDADKQSLKQLSFAFMRRFAFVAVPLPPPTVYENLLRELATNLQTVPAATVDSVVSLFSEESTGFGAAGMPFGPAIPLAMLRHARNRVALDQDIQSEPLLRELIEAYVIPQLQGRADLHEGIVELLDPLMPTQMQAFEPRLAVWTGYIPAAELTE